MMEERLLAAQGRTAEITLERWRSFTEIQRLDVIKKIPLITPLKQYKQLLIDPEIHWNSFYFSHALSLTELRDFTGAKELLETISICNNLCIKEEIKRMLENISLFEKFLSSLSLIYDQFSVYDDFSSSIPSDICSMNSCESKESRQAFLLDIIYSASYERFIHFDWESLLGNEIWLITKLIELAPSPSLLLYFSKLIIPNNCFYSLPELNFRANALEAFSMEPFKMDLSAFDEPGDPLEKAKLTLPHHGVKTLPDLIQVLQQISDDCCQSSVIAADQPANWSSIYQILQSKLSGHETVNLPKLFELIAKL